MTGKPPAVVTLGFGPFGAPGLVVTLGFGIPPGGYVRATASGQPRVSSTPAGTGAVTAIPSGGDGGA